MFFFNLNWFEDQQKHHFGRFRSEQQFKFIPLDQIEQDVQ